VGGAARPSQTRHSPVSDPRSQSRFFDCRINRVNCCGPAACVCWTESHDESRASHGQDCVQAGVRHTLIRCDPDRAQEKSSVTLFRPPLSTIQIGAPRPRWISTAPRRAGKIEDQFNGWSYRARKSGSRGPCWPSPAFPPGSSSKCLNWWRTSPEARSSGTSRPIWQLVSRAEPSTYPVARWAISTSATASHMATMRREDSPPLRY
jgi:hypothetical protein